MNLALKQPHLSRTERISSRSSVNGLQQRKGSACLCIDCSEPKNGRQSPDAPFQLRNALWQNRWQRATKGKNPVCNNVGRQSFLLLLETLTSSGWRGPWFLGKRRGFGDYGDEYTGTDGRTTGTPKPTGSAWD